MYFHDCSSRGHDIWLIDYDQDVHYLINLKSLNNLKPVLSGHSKEDPKLYFRD